MWSGRLADAVNLLNLEGKKSLIQSDIFNKKLALKKSVSVRASLEEKERE